MMLSRVALRSVRAIGATSARGMATATARTQQRSVNSLAVGAGVGVAALTVGFSQAKSEGLYDTVMNFFGLGGGVSDEWAAVEVELKALIEDDANLGPFMVRLAWHCSGSYNKSDGTGGSNGATMRFSPEAAHDGNAGLNEMRDHLEPIKAAHPDLTYADLYTFAGKVAIETMGGPTIQWKAGRSDFASGEGVTPDGRLPDAAQGAVHLRNIFGDYGFDDKEIVALSGAHSMGFCHDDRSGFVGPWTDEPYAFTNKFYTNMMDKKWQLKNWSGPAQFEDVETQTLMMLPTDMALLVDPAFRVYVDAYAANNELFRADFAEAFAQLLEQGVPRT